MRTLISRLRRLEVSQAVAATGPTVAQWQAWYRGQDTSKIPAEYIADFERRQQETEAEIERIYGLFEDEGDV